MLLRLVTAAAASSSPPKVLILDPLLQLQLLTLPLPLLPTVVRAREKTLGAKASLLRQQRICLCLLTNELLHCCSDERLNILQQ